MVGSNSQNSKPVCNGFLLESETKGWPLSMYSGSWRVPPLSQEKNWMHNHEKEQEKPMQILKFIFSCSRQIENTADSTSNSNTIYRMQRGDLTRVCIFIFINAPFQFPKPHKNLVEVIEEIHLGNDSNYQDMSSSQTNL